MTDQPGVSFDRQGEPAPGGHPGYGPPPGYPPYGYPYLRAGYGPAGPPHEKPSSNIGWAIAAVFTFWPLAIPAFVYANKVDAFWFAGNRAGAEQASEDARLWGMVGVVIGVALVVLLAVWVVVLVSVTTAASRVGPTPVPYPS